MIRELSAFLSPNNSASSKAPSIVRRRASLANERKATGAPAFYWVSIATCLKAFFRTKPGGSAGSR